MQPRHAHSARILSVDHFQSDGGKWNKYAIHDRHSTSFSAFKGCCQAFANSARKAANTES